MQVIISVL